MTDLSFEQRLETYGAWRSRLADALASFHDFLKHADLLPAEIASRIPHAIASLADDRLHIAFVAEFSRGKSELINALFFADFGARLLPSGAGRTTMCPTEILHDASWPSGLRLLPIETRGDARPLGDYRDDPAAWETISLDLAAPKTTAAVLTTLAETRRVPRADAEAFGFPMSDQDGGPELAIGADGMVEVPRWRHAIVNLPHPLLTQGLTILDTPGLNALGAEPELTLSMLPSAHAILFLLAADTGVTQSDMAVWRDHIGVVREGSNRGRIVVLNKIDGLWDELRDPDDIERDLRRMVRETARHLSIPPRNIYPISAQKGLIGKLRGDAELVSRSGIRTLEEALVRDVLPARQEIVRESVRGAALTTAGLVRARLRSEVSGLETQAQELASLGGRNSEVLGHLDARVQREQAAFNEAMRRLATTHGVLARQEAALRGQLDLAQLDSFIARIRRDMEISFTTVGLRQCMEELFVSSIHTMNGAADRVRQIRALVESSYRIFRKEHGYEDIKAPRLSLRRYVRELMRIQDAHRHYMRGAGLVFREQRTLTRRFFETAGTRVRTVYRLVNRETDQWLGCLMGPLEERLRATRRDLDQRLMSVEKLKNSTLGIEGRRAELDHAAALARTREEEFARHVALLGGMLGD